MLTSMVTLLMFGVLVSAPLAGAIGQTAEPPAGFRALFNGRDLDGWWGAETEDPRGWMALEPDALAARKQASLEDICAHWRVENGELVNDGEGLYLTTNDNFRDFELRLEYRTVAGADSGIYLKGCPQVQIWDTTEAGGKWNIGAGKGSGGLWNNSPGEPGKDPLVHADRPFGEWNSVRVVMVGERVSVHLNDQLVVDHARLENYFDRRKPIPVAGPIQLQTHGGEIRWRNVFIRKLPVDEANAFLAAHDAEGFEPIFNGRDLTGWTGATQGYEVADGAIQCRPGSGGNLFTERELSDFDARLLIRIPPGGNNGLAIRYPGEGDPAYAGMCELQVLDSEAPEYADLDPRQYHASVYGQVAAERGYLREPGKWNFQRVTVVGPRITVELNGTRIVDADISTIDELMYARDKFPGRDRTSGHFGFAGHGDPVAFRDIAIRDLEDD
jgi:hypothetical protein